MTYCVGLQLDKGIVFMSDTRTNAGVDNVSVFKKMFTWEVPGERLITLMTAGNLATTQSVVSLLDERAKAPSERSPSLVEVPSMFQVATLIGKTLREVISSSAETGQAAETKFSGTVVVGGQIKGGEPRLFLIYPEGNFVEASRDTPFFQAGETKYGRPILVRAYDAQMSFSEAVKLLLVSFDSTIKANLSVGLPIDLQIYEANSFKRGMERRITADDPYFQLVSNGWGEALKSAFSSIPDPEL
ncbi:MAG: proteasome-type protease [Phyllobacteriaceae bacterium]|nr:proteasome-type protease [Nitratireductor sp.]MCO5134501.1 proteasome-type protease [Phyllobacteriaceae bacterium]